MFAEREQELIKLQHQLDRDRQLLNRARELEETTPQDAQTPFCMIDLYNTIPGCDTSSFRMSAYRE